MPRRFITRKDIDLLADAGRDTLEIDATVTVTDVAREYARSRSVRIVRVATPVASNGHNGHDDDGRAEPTRSVIREQIRRAVRDQMGEEPPELARVIDRVLAAKLDGAAG